jgi:hypothetical protein
MEAIAGAEVADDSGPDLCALAHTLVNDLRSSLPLSGWARDCLSVRTFHRRIASALPEM